MMNIELLFIRRFHYAKTWEKAVVVIKQKIDNALAENMLT